jgi:hypothetical protein
MKYNFVRMQFKCGVCIVCASQWVVKIYPYVDFMQCYEPDAGSLGHPQKLN